MMMMTSPSPPPKQQASLPNPKTLYSNTVTTTKRKAIDQLINWTMPEFAWLFPLVLTMAMPTPMQHTSQPLHQPDSYPIPSPVTYPPLLHHKESLVTSMSQTTKASTTCRRQTSLFLDSDSIQTELPTATGNNRMNNCKNTQQHPWTLPLCQPKIPSSNQDIPIYPQWCMWYSITHVPMSPFGNQMSSTSITPCPRPWDPASFLITQTLQMAPLSSWQLHQSLQKSTNYQIHHLHPYTSISYPLYLAGNLPAPLPAPTPHPLGHKH